MTRYAHLNAKFDDLPVFTPHPAFTKTSKGHPPIWEQTCRTIHITPRLESKFIDHLIKKYSKTFCCIWEQA